MKVKLLLAVLGVLLLVPMASWATCTTATVGNLSDVTFDVCYTISGNDLTITNVTGSVSGGGTLNPVKLLDISVYSGYTGISTAMTNWQTATSADCNDGFSSSFAGCLTQNPANDALLPGSVGPFTLAGTNGSVLLHVGFGTCSGFVNFVPEGSTGTLLSAPSSSKTASEAGCTIVPEPGSLALLGSGLVGAAAFLRRRFLKM